MLVCLHINKIMVEQLNTTIIVLWLIDTVQYIVIQGIIMKITIDIYINGGMMSVKTS